MTDEVRDRQLFAVIREIVGRGLTQQEVDRINGALYNEIIVVAKNGRRCSSKGISLIHSFEQCRLTTYKDPGSKNGLPITGGWGTTRDHNGKPFALGFTANQEYWDRLFERDLQIFENGVNSLLGNAPTTQEQFDALVSFAYNVGLDIDDDTVAEGLGDSTLLKKHLRGDYEGARAAFGSWIYNDGKKMNGLVRRRAAEAALYAS